MGNCFCLPVSTVTQNPSVAMYTEVGRAVITHHQSGIVMEASLFPGMMYVIGDRVFYNSKWGSMFWCECTSGSDWFLSDIKNIEVATGNFTLYNRNGVDQSFSMNPGLIVTFWDNSCLMVDMPDAVNFNIQLRQYKASHPSTRRSIGHPGAILRPPAATSLSDPFQPAGPPSLFKNRARPRPSMPAQPPQTLESNQDSDKVALLA